MTDNELENRLATFEKLLLARIEVKPSTVRKFWDWAKPYIVPFIFGVIVGGMFVNIPTPAFPLVSKISSNSTPKLEQQAASGGAAIPFPSESPLPSPLTPPPGYLIEEMTDSSLTSISEEPSPPVPQVDNGQRTSRRYSRPLLRRMR